MSGRERNLNDRLLQHMREAKTIQDRMDAARTIFLFDTYFLRGTDIKDDCGDYEMIRADIIHSAVAVAYLDGEIEVRWKETTQSAGFTKEIEGNRASYIVDIDPILGMDLQQVIDVMVDMYITWRKLPD